MDSEQLKTPKTDCLLKVKKTKKSISLDSRCADLENTRFCATLKSRPILQQMELLGKSIGTIQSIPRPIFL